jgi:type IV pilus assembly protein PilA
MIVVAIIGLLSAIAIPNFVKFQARSKQSEVKAGMRAIFTSQKAYYQEHTTFTNYAAAVGFAPERGNRYSYDLGGGQLSDRSTSVETTYVTENGIGADTFKYGSSDSFSASMPSSVVATVNVGNTGNFTATAAGNVDNDNDIDQWSISSLSRSSGTSTVLTACTAGNNPAGEACNDFDDV